MAVADVDGAGRGPDAVRPRARGRDDEVVAARGRAGRSPTGTAAAGRGRSARSAAASAAATCSRCDARNAPPCPWRRRPAVKTSASGQASQIASKTRSPPRRSSRKSWTSATRCGRRRDPSSLDLQRRPLHPRKATRVAPTVAAVLRRVLVAAVVLVRGGHLPRGREGPRRVGRDAGRAAHLRQGRQARPGAAHHAQRPRRAPCASRSTAGSRSPSRARRPTSRARTRLILAAAKRGLRVLPVLVGSPAWARQDEKVDFSAPTAEGRFAYAVLCQEFVKRYGPNGTLWAEHPEVTPIPVRQWQIWNEPQGERFWHETPRPAAVREAARGRAHGDQGGRPRPPR